MANIVLKDIEKKYEKSDYFSVKDFNLDIQDKEFVVLVGPSGCGKSTTLRMIAGLEEITGGELIIDGKVMNDVAPKDRDIAMVFQNYALYPHMTVFDNMAFGLKLRKYDKADIEKRVNNAAEILGLTDQLKKKPAGLSGGQRQRVALGRAIVRDARIFLMDEPLSNLDAKLRVSMRAEIAKLHQNLGTTTIYVTHDQTEAMTMADRIVIMKDGFIQQIGSPKEVYDSPVNMFVAGFIGSPAMNFVEVTLNGDTITDGKSLSMKVPEGKLKVLNELGYQGKVLDLGIRPEDIHSEPVAIQANPDSVVNTKIIVSELLGAETMLYTKVDDVEFIAKVDAHENYAPGDDIELSFNLSKCHFFDKDTTKVIGE